MNDFLRALANRVAAKVAQAHIMVGDPETFIRDVLVILDANGWLVSPCERSDVPKDPYAQRTLSEKVKDL